MSYTPYTMGYTPLHRGLHPLTYTRRRSPSSNTMGYTPLHHGLQPLTPWATAPYLHQAEIAELERRALRAEVRGGSTAHT